MLSGLKDYFTERKIIMSKNRIRTYDTAPWDDCCICASAINDTLDRYYPQNSEKFYNNMHILSAFDTNIYTTAKFIIYILARRKTPYEQIPKKLKQIIILAKRFNSLRIALSIHQSIER